jgi:hypothetical protein
MKTLNFITGNKNKLAEVQAILGNTVLIQNRAIDVPEIQGTPEEIAKEKCRRAAEVVSFAALLKQRSSYCSFRTHGDLQLTLPEPDRRSSLDGGYGA